MLELLAQRCQASRKSGLHGTHRYAEQGRRLLLGTVLGVAQHDDNPLVRRERPDGPSQLILGVDPALETAIR